MLELVINRGVPGSGKSTFAKAWVTAGQNRARSNRDDIRFQTYGTFFGSPIDENVVTLIQHAGIEAALKAGVSVIVDDCNIEMKYIKALTALGYKNGANVRIQQHDVPVEVAIERNNNRDRKVPDEVIRKMGKRMKDLGAIVLPEKPANLIQYIANQNARKAIMVDVDGTIAEMHNRGPFDWKSVGNDLPIQSVIDVVNLYANEGYAIIIMSGRDSVCKQETMDWLDKHNVFWDDIFMRPERDARKDSIVKYELFNENVRDEYDVQFVLDDRNQVVEMWRSIGLKVFQVAEGNF